MSVNLSYIDLAGLIERKAPVRLGKAYGNGSKRTRKGPCPWCGGTHRFAVFVGEEPQRYYCGIHGDGCGARGDAVNFLREYCGLSWREACEELGVEPGEYTAPGSGARKVGQIASGPSKKWVDQATAFAHQAHKYLFTPAGKTALDYLIGRGLSVETIKHFKLGYCPKWEKQDASLWGQDDRETVTVAEGIVIPSYVDGVLWHLDTRRLRKFSSETSDQFKKRRYHEIPGGKTCLFNSDMIEAGRPVIVTEGRIDAMTAWQGCSELAACVATGSAGDARGAQWAMTLALASRVLIAFDNDEAGKNAARYWSRIIKGARYYPPYEHDINDTLLAGHDLREWLEVGLDVLFDDDAPAAEQGEPLLCTTCGTNADLAPADQIFIFSDNGLPYCSEACKSLDDQATPEHVSTLAEEVGVLVGRQVDEQRRLAMETVSRLASVGVHLFVHEGHVCIDAAYDVGEKAKAFVLEHEPELLAWLSEEEADQAGPLNHPVVKKLMELAPGGVHEIEILDCTIEEYITRRKQELAAHRPALTDTTSVEQELMSRLSNYGMRMASAPCSVCGCRLEWNSAGSILCARCEPGGLWSAASTELLKGLASSRYSS